jgi:hypothetical protein
MSEQHSSGFGSEERELLQLYRRAAEPSLIPTALVHGMDLRMG